MIKWERGEQGARSLRLRGTLADHHVAASVAVVGNSIHLFTRVRRGPITHLFMWVGRDRINKEGPFSIHLFTWVRRDPLINYRPLYVGGKGRINKEGPFSIHLFTWVRIDPFI